MRLALYGVLVVLGALLIGQLWQDKRHGAEWQRDTEIITLASRQGMWSQHIARLGALPVSVPVPVPSDRRQAAQNLREAIDAARAEALRLAVQVDQQSRGAGTQPLRDALKAWEVSTERLTHQAENVRRNLLEHGEPHALRTAVEALQMEAAPMLEASERLARHSAERADALNVQAAARQTQAELFGAMFLVLLALGVVEPTVRAVRRQTQRMAAQAEEQACHALVAERTTHAALVGDARGRIRWANQAFERITGYTSEEIIGHDPVRLLQAADADPHVVQRIREAQLGGFGVRVELPTRSRIGHDYWLDLDLQPLHDAAGAVTGFVLVAGDITERVTERLRTAALLAALPTGVLVQDERGRNTECNPAALRMLGLSSEQLFRQAPLPEHWKVLREDLSECPLDERPGIMVLRSGQSLQGLTLGVTRADGELRWLLVNAEPIIDALGRSAGVVTCFIDVTDQRNQRVILEMTVAAAGVGTWQWDMLSGEYVVNERLMTMLGYRAGEFAQRGRVIDELIHPDDVEPRRLALQTHLKFPEIPFRCEQRLRRPDGEWATVLSCGTVIERSESGSPRRMAGLHFDLTEQMQMQAMLRHAARTDGLTQLPNRAAVFDRVQQVLQRAASQPGFGYAVLFMDFDRFKQVNDTLGHAVGDELLRQIAQRLRSALRAGDLVGHTPLHGLANEPANGDGPTQRAVPSEPTAGRIGGDEFVVVLEHVRGRDNACAVARRLLEKLAEPYRIGAHVVHSTASIGIVTSEQAANDVHTVMRDADTAMYEAKRNGRGRYAVFDPSMHERVAHSLAIENDLRLAIERDELFVVYQPVVDLSAARGSCVEALVRWRHPTRGLVPPGEFIPVAEESGLIVEVGRQVLAAACRQFMAWRQQLGDKAPVSVAVNLSSIQLRHATLLDDVQACLRATGIKPHQLQLEVTESLAAQDELARARLRDLKSLGLGLSLDDFGTGYSSLACLHQLPVDTVKIDRSFVSHVEHSEYHRALIEATIRVAQTLGMSTVAEGIETEGQAALMAQLQCSRGQGYAFSKPLEPGEVMRWLARRADAMAAQGQAA